MKKFLNTLYITTEDAYLSLNGETVDVIFGDSSHKQIPLHTLNNIVSFSYKGASTADVNTETAAGRKRLAKIAKICCNYGQRVQNSVFECDLDASQMVIVKNQLLGIINRDMDSIRIYNLGNKYSSKIEQHGRKESYDPEGNVIL